MRRLLALERHARIVSLVNRQGIVAVSELARRLGASPMTVRRDVAALDAQGLLRRTHGGAVALSAPPDVPLERRKRLELQAKTSIGRLAAGLVQAGETVLLDAGTTALAVARALRGIPDLTVVTSSVQVVAELWARPELRVVVVGGLVRSASGSITGPLAEKALEEIRVDKAFLGTTGITPRWEVSNSDLDLAALQRRVLAVARERYVLADHTKIGRTGLAMVAPLKLFTALLTDSHVPAEMLARLRRHASKVLVAGGEQAAGSASPAPKTVRGIP
ncbi:MAG: DeoR/GlpR family DNA-binding transcription regulator [Candidatus Methylomirabilales bacterium]